jgi:hypothetical protein
MIDWLRNRSLPARILLYATVATLAFVLAAGVGAIGALMLRGELTLPSGEGPGSSREQANAPQPQGDTDRAPQSRAAAEHSGAGDRAKSSQSQHDGAARQEGIASQQTEAEYISKVGDIQNRSVDTFLDCHAKLRRYDALATEDIEELRADQAALQGFAEQVDETDPPQGYTEQYEAFGSAVNEMHEGAQLAYSLAADPVAATHSRFEEYDRRVSEADAHLQESNELLGRKYKSLEGVQEASPS